MWPRIPNPISRLLDRITSYRLLLYSLIGLVGLASVFSVIGFLHFAWYAIPVAAAWTTLVCFASNRILGRVFGVATNRESDLITGLILTLIMPPDVSANGLIVLGVAGLLAMASKYVITQRNSLIFNPAALGGFAASMIFNVYPLWWVGTPQLAFASLLVALLMLAKMKRFSMAGAFTVVVLLTIVKQTHEAVHFLPYVNHLLQNSIYSTPVIFFIGVMLIEPLTAPTPRIRGILFGLIVGGFYATSMVRPFSIALPPEQALLLGNVFTLLVGSGQRLRLSLATKHQEASEIFSFNFGRPADFHFRAGQYMEWALDHPHADSRGNRRYFSIGSSPTESELMVTVRVPKESSSYKKALVGANPGQEVLAGQLSGDFVLPKDASKKLAFLAGGVGIVPYRSMIKYLVDSGEKRDIILIYSANSPDEFAYTGLFEKARTKVGLREFYTLTDSTRIPADWRGLSGVISPEMIGQTTPDFRDRTFYLSGPLGFVRGTEATLRKMGVPKRRIKVDYFPGYD